METQSVVILKDLIQQQSNIALPQALLERRIELSDPDSIESQDCIFEYDTTQNILELRFLAYDPYGGSDDYWSNLDVGEIINGSSSRIYEEIESLNEANYPYFLVATFEHSMVKHYLIRSKSEISTCHWDTGISGIFVPSSSLVKECNNDPDLMMQRLQSYFEEYTDWCNGEIYKICKDRYDLNTDQNLLLITECDAVGGFIGYQNAKESLITYF